MTETTEKTVIIKNQNYTQGLIDTIFCFVELLLVIRLLMKLAAADAANAIVGGIYTLTNVIVTPFKYLIGDMNIVGARDGMIFEGSTIMAILVVGLIASIITSLYRRNVIEIIKEKRTKKSE